LFSTHLYSSSTHYYILYYILYRI